jgi:hypothetical protein
MTWDNVAFSGVVGGVIGTLGAYGAAWYTIRADREADRERHKDEVAENLLENLIAMRRRLLLTDDRSDQEIVAAIREVAGDWTTTLGGSIRLGEASMFKWVTDIANAVEPASSSRQPSHSEVLAWKTSILLPVNAGISEAINFLASRMGSRGTTTVSSGQR